MHLLCSFSRLFTAQDKTWSLWNPPLFPFYLMPKPTLHFKWPSLPSSPELLLQYCHLQSELHAAGVFYERKSGHVAPCLKSSQYSQNKTQFFTCKVLPVLARPTFLSAPFSFLTSSGQRWSHSGPLTCFLFPIFASPWSFHYWLLPLPYVSVDISPSQKNCPLLSQLKDFLFDSLSFNPFCFLEFVAFYNYVGLFLRLSSTSWSGTVLSKGITSHMCYWTLVQMPVQWDML